MAGVLPGMLLLLRFSSLYLDTLFFLSTNFSDITGKKKTCCSVKIALPQSGTVCYTIAMHNVNEYVRLFLVFCKIGAITFGGGLAMLPILERELADRRGWTTSEQLLDYYAIGQSTPGIIAVNVATFIGYNRKGILGGIIATLGIVTPSIVIITILAAFINNFAEIDIVQKALSGINVAVAALLVSAVWKLGKSGIKDWIGFLIALVSFCAIAFFNVQGIFIIVIAGFLGFAAKNPLSKKKNNTDTVDEDI